MSRLSVFEFRAMNEPWRRVVQRLIEFPMLQYFGIPIAGQDVLEIGCGSGYGAVLLAGLNPRSYIGIDLMPEQITLAKQRLPIAHFLVQNAAHLKDIIADASIDTIVIFGVLHHIPEWKDVVSEMRRVLRPGGEIYLEEPDGVAIFLRDLEAYLLQKGFNIVRKVRFGFGFYHLQKAENIRKGTL